jgi:hypothetical protein
LDNLTLFGGLQGAKEPQDLGINANFGARGHVNWAVPLPWLGQYGVGVQAGTALNYSLNAVRVLGPLTGSDDRLQSFTTIGLFQHSAWGINWAVAYDFLEERYYQDIDLGQWRGQAGYCLDANNEVGVWGTVATTHTDGALSGQAFRLEPISQVYLFWRHVWPNDAVTRVWGGVAGDHGRFVLVSPGEPNARHPVGFGADVFLPLNERWAIFGEANFITPNDTGTVTATFGLAYNFGGSRTIARGRFAPMLPVANNNSFAVDLRQ